MVTIISYQISYMEKCSLQHFVNKADLGSDIYVYQ